MLIPNVARPNIMVFFRPKLSEKKPETIADILTPMYINVCPCLKTSSKLGDSIIQPSIKADMPTAVLKIIQGNKYFRKLVFRKILNQLFRVPAYLSQGSISNVTMLNPLKKIDNSNN
jgi:hypothetical protein